MLRHGRVLSLILGLILVMSVIVPADLYAYHGTLPQRGSSSKNMFPGLSPEESETIVQQSIIFSEILYIYATQSLNKPDNLLACAQEMLQMKPDEKSCRDKHSVYLPKESEEELDNEMRGRFGGVGMEVGMRDGKVVVIAPIDGTPAHKAGILSGDEILEVDGVKVQSLADAVKKMRGKPGTLVKITLGRGGKSIDFEIVREEIVVRAIRARALDGNIGYIKIRIFNKIMSDEFRAEMKKFRDGGITKVIIDLRNNPGGLMWSALDVLYDIAKPNDILMVMRERKKETVFDTKLVGASIGGNDFFVGDKPPGTFRDMKIAVLVNEGSASASEIFAGTMKDWGYPIVGPKEGTFGKGVGQKVFPLSDGSAFKLTTFEFFVGNSRTKIDGVGVKPTHSVDTKEKHPGGALSENDKQLEKAVEILSK